MEIALSDDQEFFRDTTRKFLSSECPIPKVRALRARPRRLRARLLAPGCRAGLDVDAGARGARRRQRQRQRPRRPRPRGRRLRRHVAPGPLLPCNVVAAALARSGHRRTPGRDPPGDHRRRGRRHVGVDRGTAARPAGRRRAPGRGRRRRLRAHRREVTGRGRRARPTSCSSPRPPTPAPRSSSSPPTRRASRSRRCAASTSCGASPASQFDGVRLPASAVVGEVGERRRRRRAPAADRGRGAERGDGRRRGGRVRPHRSTGPSAATRSAVRWRRTRRSSTASPT